MESCELGHWEFWGSCSTTFIDRQYHNTFSTIMPVIAGYAPSTVIITHQGAINLLTISYLVMWFIITIGYFVDTCHLLCVGSYYYVSYWHWENTFKENYSYQNGYIDLKLERKWKKKFHSKDQIYLMTMGMSILSWKDHADRLFTPMYDQFRVKFRNSGKRA